MILRSLPPKKLLRTYYQNRKAEGIAPAWRVAGGSSSRRQPRGLALGREAPGQPQEQDDGDHVERRQRVQRRLQRQGMARSFEIVAGNANVRRSETQADEIHHQQQ